MSPRDDSLSFDLVGDDEVSDGVGGWEDLARPRRKSAVEWVGTPAMTLVLPLLIDGTERAVGVDAVIEWKCARLFSWGRKTKKTGLPVVLRATGPIRCTAQQRWVINGLSWGGQIRNADGRRVQQYVTVTLKEYIEAAVLKGPAARARDRQGS
jgi:hypothetical protein